MSGIILTSPADSSRSGKKHGGGGANTDDDRISDLPDSIIGTILSFLPTKNAVATGILSKRWKCLWTLAGTLDFCCPPTGSVEQFVRFVNYVLLFHKHGCFHKLFLTWMYSGCIPNYVNTWIGVALDRAVSELSVCADIPMLPNQLQSSLFSSESLTSLELICNVCIPSSEMVFNLPRLERLELISVYFHNVEDIGKFVNGCPVLKSLIIDVDFGQMAKHGYVTAVGGDDLFTTNADGRPITCIISSASLTHLEICLEGYSSSQRRLKVSWVAKLDVPSLHYLKLDGFLLGISIQQESLACLEEANIEINGPVFQEPLYCNSLVKAFSAFGCAKTLTLRDRVIRALSYAPVKLTTKFNRLTTLEVDSRYWSSLLDFLMLSDNLEALTVLKEYTRLDINDVPPHNNNSNSNEVPVCLSKSLWSVLIDGYVGHRDELAMISYIIKHASVLKVVEIGFQKSVHNDFKRKFELVQEICAFPRKSAVCEVTFYDAY